MTLIEIKKLRPDAILPTRSRASDAGYDLYTSESFEIPAYGQYQVGTGLAITVPIGFFYTLEGRSSLWKHSIRPQTGIIDATYSGELRVTMCNNSNVPYTVNAGERFAQFVVHQHIETELKEVEEISYTGRGDAGFGSSGK